MQIPFSKYILIICCIFLFDSCYYKFVPKYKYADVTNFGAIPNDSIEDNLGIQNAINNSDIVYIPAGVFFINVKPQMGKNIQGGINVPSNKKIILNKNSVLKIIPTDTSKYSLFKIYNANNVSISNGLFIGDNLMHIGNIGEHGFGIDIRGSANIVVKNLNLINFWGDGIYISAYKNKLSQNINIRNVSSSNNTRNGLSITGAKKVNIVKSTFKSNNGKNPQSGIVLEPNIFLYPVSNIKVIRCNIYDNERYGISITAFRGNIINIKIKNNSIINNHLMDISIRDTANSIKIIHNKVTDRDKTIEIMNNTSKISTIRNRSF